MAGEIMSASSMVLLLGSAALAGVSLAGASRAMAADIKVIASNAVKDAYIELLPEFEQASGHKVHVDWGGTADIVKRITAGEAADCVIVPSFTIDALIKDGKLTPGSRSDLVRSAIGVAVRVGAPRPDLSSGETLKAALLASNRIVLSGGPSGGYMAGLLEKMGIADRVAPKLTRIAPGLPVGEVLARGEGDIGFTQVSEFLHIKGIDYRGALPADVQQITVFSAGIPKTAKESGAAAMLVRFLTAPERAPVLRKSGLEPG
jgi:molybdate transport system substrate-binding protein